MTIYIASKTVHGKRWQKLKASGVPIISTWIYESEKGETEDFADLWHRCITEASIANYTIVYREPNEVLKGAFIEVGASLAAGNTVFAIGCEEFSFVKHPRVIVVPSIEKALEYANSGSY